MIACNESSFYIGKSTEVFGRFVLELDDRMLDAIPVVLPHHDEFVYFRLLI